MTAPLRHASRRFPPFGHAVPDPTDGLDGHARLALCDASYGLLGRFDDGWRRQMPRPEFKHADDTIALLVGRGLLKPAAPGEDEVVAITQRGRLAAHRIRQRREAVKQWEASKRRAASNRKENL